MQITWRDKQYETKPNITARDALKKIGLDPEAVLVVVNGKLVTDDVILREGDEVKLVAVVSGGQGDGDTGTRRHRTARFLFVSLSPCLVDGGQE